MDEPETQAPKKQKTSKAKAKKKAKKDDEDWQDEDEDAYTALSKSFRAGNKPPNGSLETCAECKKEFSVVCESHLLAAHCLISRFFFRVNTP